MGFLDRFKKVRVEDIEEKPRPSEEVRRSNDHAIKMHTNRINNLNTELEELSLKLEEVESNISMPKSSKQKQSDHIIRRITLIRYEIGIREGVIKWLS